MKDEDKSYLWMIQHHIEALVTLLDMNKQHKILNNNVAYDFMHYMASQSETIWEEGIWNQVAGILLDEDLSNPEIWADLIASSDLTGVTRELAMNLVPKRLILGVLEVSLMESLEHLVNGDRIKTIEKSLSTQRGGVFKLNIFYSKEKGENVFQFPPELRGPDR